MSVLQEGPERILRPLPGGRQQEHKVPAQERRRQDHVRGLLPVSPTGRVGYWDMGLTVGVQGVSRLQEAMGRLALELCSWGYG